MGWSIDSKYITKTYVAANVVRL